MLLAKKPARNGHKLAIYPVTNFGDQSLDPTKVSSTLEASYLG